MQGYMEDASLALCRRKRNKIMKSCKCDMFRYQAGSIGRAALKWTMTNFKYLVRVSTDRRIEYKDCDLEYIYAWMPTSFLLHIVTPR